MRALVIKAKVAEWIENWLPGRKQRLTANGTASRYFTIMSGVPQGPLFFSLEERKIKQIVYSEFGNPIETSYLIKNSSKK